MMKNTLRTIAILGTTLLLLPASGVYSQDVPSIPQGPHSMTVEVREDSTTGELMEGFSVQILGLPEGVTGTPGSQAPGGLPINSLVTGPNGTVVFPDLPAGTYQAIAHPSATPRHCSALPSPLAVVDDTNPNPTTIVVVECGDSAGWQLLLLALPAVTVPDPDTP